jgi:hypothetical protein
MTVITGSHNIKVAQMIAQRSALKLECRGLKKRGRSMYAIIKQHYGLRGNRESVYTQFCELVEREKGQ